jgi:hypothetical protein
MVEVLEVSLGWPKNVPWMFFPSRRSGALDHDADPPTSFWCRAWIGHTWWTPLSQELEKLPYFDHQFIKLYLNDVPFLSGQISLKCFKSSNGRSLTIETQYLKRNPCEHTIADTTGKRYKPYRVQSLLQTPLLRLSTDKLLHGLQLAFAASLEATRVMENITFMAWKDYFVLDVMLATLHTGSSRSVVTDKNKPAQPLEKPRVEPG